jgi:hypothetical protein
MLPVHEQGLAEVPHCRLAAKLERGTFQGVYTRDQAHHGSGEKIEDIGSQYRVRHL